MDTLVLIKPVTALIMPPASLLIGLLLALCVWRSRPRLAATLVAAVTLGLYLVSMPLVAGSLARTLEVYPAVDAAEVEAFGAEAIVVLGGGRRLYAPEFGGPTISTLALARVRYAARLHRVTGLPIAVTGGTVLSPGPAEGTLMAKTLAEDFQVPVRWLETASRNTAENARFVNQILAPVGVRRVVVLSHANHLPRAVEMFRDQGFQVLPAPTAFFSNPSPDGALGLSDLLPSSRAMNRTRVALHEHLGLLWYRLNR